MRLTLDLDLDALGPDAPAEAGRILRYWAGALGQVDLSQPAEYPLMDSAYAQVGSIAVGQSSGDGDVKTHLHGYLRRLHEALLWKIDGLGERDARWPMTPTGTNLLGVLKHVASIEAEYFGHAFGRPFPEPMPWLDDDAEANADLYAAPEETIGSIRAFAERVWAHADATIDALDLGARGHVPWWGERGDVTLAQILVHVIADVARHTGHADIVRELLDGASGLSVANSNLPEGDEQWWADYVEKLKEIATGA
ncbi:DinB family protein [Pseudactinotalea sp.]|uniref:DinB family protein n=1 Tax=Pseudactinotalea sp. TaxID=1926260 RepID=UPI003B3B2F4F